VSHSVTTQQLDDEALRRLDSLRYIFRGKKKGIGFGIRSLLNIAGAGFEPATFGLCLPLRLSPPESTSLWSGLSLHPQLYLLGRLPLSLYAFFHHFEVMKAWFGITTAKGFPEFER